MKNLLQSLSLFSLAFRPFFLFGAIFSVLAISVWLLSLNGILFENLYGDSHFWHIHEMIFGFTAAIIVGFLLTAVQNWTGNKSVSGWALGVLFLVWVAGRISFLIVTQPSIWVAVIDILFLILSAFFLSLPIIKARQWRNLFFVPLLIIFSICNLIAHLGVINDSYDLTTRGIYSALMLIAFIMVVIGGRVIPFFTANTTFTKKPDPILNIERLSFASVGSLLLIFLFFPEQFLPDWILALLFTISAIVQLIRWCRWRFWLTFKIPLLWSLHLAYLFIISAFLVLALHFWGLEINMSIGWHLLTIGGMGLLILSMISRVSLGHTGRAIEAPRSIVVAFILMFFCVLIRTSVANLLLEDYIFYITISGILWISAFAIFVIQYFNILTKPRVDGKAG